MTGTADDVPGYMLPIERWSQPIGRTLLLFGLIESLADICLEHIPTENVYNELKGSGLSHKLDLIVAFTKSLSPDPIPKDEAERLNSAIGKVKKRLDLRNLIAHNPVTMQLDFKEDGSYEVQEIREAIVHIHNEDRRINFEQLQETLPILEQETKEFVDSSVLAVNSVLAAKRQV